ncbi:O-antigen ligase family protein [Aestuariimicrobium soli]|uniref:O-antigen ligase family protein n=1 Tax=Aestuariimicrobium soli TaxID=2035834 RepID=UPI003EBF9A38
MVRPMSQLTALLGWLLFPVLALTQFVDVRRGVIGPAWLWGFQLFMFAGLVVVTAAWLWTRRRDLPAVAWVVGGLFLTILVWGAIRVPYNLNPHSYAKVSPEFAPPAYQFVPDIYREVPLLIAGVTLLAAWGCLLVIPAARRFDRVWALGWLVLVTSLLSWGRALITRGEVRLTTGMGGAATVHLVFLTTLALFLGAWRAGHHRRWSLAGAAVSIACLLCTQSRAGLVSLVVLAVLVVGWWGRGRIGRLPLLVGLGAAVAIGAVVTLVPSLSRLLHFSDGPRLTNLRTGLRIWNLDWTSRLVGAGPGKVWPWYGFDAKFYLPPWHSQMITPYGTALSNPHSVYLGTLVEYGVLGLALMLVVLVAPVVATLRRRGADPRRTMVALALAAGLTSMAFDHYLFKNFSVSLWWWLLVGLMLCSWGDGERAQTPPGEDEVDDPASSSESSPAASASASRSSSASAAPPRP